MWAPVFLPREELWRRLLTLSCVNVLAGEDLVEMERVFGEAVGRGDVLRDGEGRIAVHGVTVMAWTAKL